VITRLLYPAFVLAAVALSVACGDALACAAAGGGALALRFVRARGWRSPRPGGKGLALANLVTTARLLVVVSLPLLFATLPRAALAGVVVLVLVVDGVDGYLARSRGEVSAFGAEYDMETDALCVMVLSLLLLQSGVGPWVLVAGLWRYVFAAAVVVAPALGDCPPSPIYRWIFTTLMLAFAVALLPLGRLAPAAAALGTVLVSFSFVHSIVRSRAFAGRLGGVTSAARPGGTPSSTDRT